ncbi:hypothetical protein Ddye_019400 [Dipteronia dyeriana]|uniref:F-box domain-containing protein n=1 Tax=Dipteronia dyeriana TaxID=168575 RepID=A0AAD9WVZ8_9ROSI|nr:hypothetical protein Ddye_019400 [Dipteronia dyeriana]
MALGGKRGWLRVKRGVMDAEDGLGLGFVKYTRGLGRKRILISNVAEMSSSSSSEKITRTPLKRQCSARMVDFECDVRFQLEFLPQDVLIRIISGVNHEDLKQLFHVSKAIREATQIAKEQHFAYSTPKKTQVFRSPIEFEESSEFDEIEAPNAPKQFRAHKSRISREKLAGISVALFASPKKELFMEE